MGDSGLIVRHLTERYEVWLDATLSPAERAVAQAFTTMLEEHLYFDLVYSRWIEDAHWPVVRGTFLGRLPAAAQEAVRAGKLDALRAQGLGGHEAAKVYARPSTVDATVSGFVSNLLSPAFDTPLRAAAARRPSLVAYRDRLTRELFPDFAG